MMVIMIYDKNKFTICNYGSEGLWWIGNDGIDVLLSLELHGPIRFRFGYAGGQLAEIITHEEMVAFAAGFNAK